MALTMESLMELSKEVFAVMIIDYREKFGNALSALPS